MKRINWKRFFSAILAMALVLSLMPSVVLWEAKAAEPETKATSSRKTVYISSSGSEWYAGTSESRPKKDITKIPTYLAQGYNVMLKRGDVWYLPYSSITLSGFSGTEDSPLVLGSYGDANAEKPTIAFLKQITKWTVVDSAKNIYKANVSDMTERSGTGIRVHRLFEKGKPYYHRNITDYTQLEAEEYFDYNGTLYVRTNGGAPTNVEVTPYAGIGIRFMVNNVSHLTIENIHFKGSSALNPVIKLTVPTSHVKFKYCDMTHCFYYLFQIVANGDSAENNYKPEIAYCTFDPMFSEKKAQCLTAATGMLVSQKV